MASGTGRLDRQRQPGRYHKRTNSRLYRRGYKVLPHAVWGDAFGAAPGPVNPGPNPPAGGTVAVGLWDWTTGEILEADVGFGTDATTGFIDIHAIDIPDNDHTVLFNDVAPGWWVYLTLAGVSKRIKVTAVSKVGAVYSWTGDLDSVGAATPVAGDDVSVYLQMPNGQYVTGPMTNKFAANPGAYNIPVIQEYLDDHPVLALAQAIRNAEADRPSPRTTLLDWLDGFIESLDGPD